MAPRWYVLRSKPRKERSLVKLATTRGHDVFYPKVPLNPVNPRARKVGPYFPGYMFVHSDLEVEGRDAFRWMPFSLGLVRLGGEPAPVSGTFIAALRGRLREIWEAGGLALDDIEPGDEVIIREGAFEGYEAVFNARLSGRDRVRVLLKMLSERHVLLELDAGALEKVDR